MPRSRVYGADIDSGVLFSEDRIRTTVVDQTVRSTFDAMTRDFGCEHFDLIVDDGLHSIEANFNTLSFAAVALKPGGWVVIEDIPDRTVEAWRLLGRVLGGSGTKCVLIRCRQAYLFAVRRPDG